MNFPTAAEHDPLIAEVLVGEEELRGRVVELGAEISRDYAGLDPVLVGVLKGAVFFIADLVRTITVTCEIDFMAVSSYGNTTDSSGVVRILKDLDTVIEGRHVLIVEDIVDSGPHALVSRPQPRGPEARLARGLRPPDEARQAQVEHPLPLRRVRDRQPVRDRLRARLCRALPEPAVRRCPRRVEAPRAARLTPFCQPRYRTGARVPIPGLAEPPW